MGINVLTLSSAFAGNAFGSAVAPRPEATQNTNQFCETPENARPSSASTDAVTAPCAEETITTDNKRTFRQNEPISRALRDSGTNFRKTLSAQTSPGVQDETELNKQGRNHLALGEPNPGQLLSNQDCAVAVLGKPTTEKPATEALNQNKPNSLIIGANIAQSASVASLLQNKAVQSGIGASQTTSETVAAGASDSSILTDATQENGNGPTPAGDSQTATMGQATTVLGVSAVSQGQTASPLNGQELTSKMLTGEGKTTTDGDESNQTGQSAIGAQKTTVLDGTVAALNDKFTDFHQDEGLGAEKAAFFVQKSTSDDVSTLEQIQSPVSEDAAKWAASQKGSKLHSDSGKTQTENTSGESILHKLNPAQIQVSTNQSRGGGSSTSKNESGSDLPQTLSESSTLNQVADNPSAARQITKGAGNPLPSSGYSGVGDQIRESIYSLASGGDQRITIRLNPPELGYVSIKLVEQADEITGLLEVSRSQTRYEIEQVLPEVLRNLADSGVQMKRLDVSLADQSEQQTYKDESLQDGWAGQHNSTEGGNLESKSANQYVENDYGYQEITETHQMFVTDNSINMLV